MVVVTAWPNGRGERQRPIVRPVRGGVEGDPAKVPGGKAAASVPCLGVPGPRTIHPLVRSAK